MVLEGNKMVALVANTTPTSVKLKQRILLGHTLAFDGQVVPEPTKFSRACISAVHQNSIASSKTSQPALVDSLGKVMDYSGHRDSLYITK